MSSRQAWLAKFKKTQDDRTARAVDAKQQAAADAAARKNAEAGDDVKSGMTLGQSKAAFDAASGRVGDGQRVLLTAETSDLFGADGRLKASGDDDGDGDEAVFRVAGAVEAEQAAFYAHLKRKVQESRRAAAGGISAATSEFTPYEAGTFRVDAGAELAVGPGTDANGGGGGTVAEDEQSWREPPKTASEFAAPVAEGAGGLPPKKKKSKKPRDDAAGTATSSAVPVVAGTFDADEAAAIAEAKAAREKREAARKRLAAAAELPDAEAAGARGSAGGAATGAGLVSLATIEKQVVDDSAAPGAPPAADAPPAKKHRQDNGGVADDAVAGRTVAVTDPNAGFTSTTLDDLAAPKATPGAPAATTAPVPPAASKAPENAAKRKGPSAMARALAMAKSGPAASTDPTPVTTTAAARPPGTAGPRLLGATAAASNLLANNSQQP